MPNVRERSTPFPWLCQQCGKQAVEMTTIEYCAEMRHDGRVYSYTIPTLQLPVCRECGEKVFTEDVDRQIRDALRAHLRLLTPDAMRKALTRIGLSQKEAALRLGIAEATLSRWLNHQQIQIESMDRLLRVFFAFPEVREALAARPLGEDFGMRDLPAARSPSCLSTPAEAPT